MLRARLPDGVRIHPGVDGVRVPPGAGIYSTVPGRPEKVRAVRSVETGLRVAPLMASPIADGVTLHDGPRLPRANANSRLPSRAEIPPLNVPRSGPSTGCTRRGRSAARRGPWTHGSWSGGLECPVAPREPGVSRRIAGANAPSWRAPARPSSGSSSGNGAPSPIVGEGRHLRGPAPPAPAAASWVALAERDCLASGGSGSVRGKLRGLG